MPVTVRNTDILFNDGTTQSTAAGAPTTAQILNATAGASVGAVGTYAFLFEWDSNNTGTPQIVTNVGGTRAGSSLRYGNSNISNANLGSPTTPPGTWRCMGVSVQRFVGMYGSWSGFPAVWLRIS
jgi:hypothetical protein